jgi:hypothetical protein
MSYEYDTLLHKPPRVSLQEHWHTLTPTFPDGNQTFPE